MTAAIVSLLRCAVFQDRTEPDPNHTPEPDPSPDQILIGLCLVSAHAGLCTGACRPLHRDICTEMYIACAGYTQPLRPVYGLERKLERKWLLIGSSLI